MSDLITSQNDQWGHADAYACWALGLRLQREKGLRAGKFKPVNDDERRYLDEVKKL